MKYLVRAVKYFFYFAFLSTAIILALVLIGAVEGDINSIFEGGWSALYSLGRKVMTNLDSILKKRHYFADKGLSSQSYGFSTSHVWM